MGFMQCGGEGIIESVRTFSHKKTFPPHFFCNLEAEKVFCSVREKLEVRSFLAPHCIKPLSVICHFKKNRVK